MTLSVYDPVAALTRATRSDQAALLGLILAGAVVPMDVRSIGRR